MKTKTKTKTLTINYCSRDTIAQFNKMKKKLPRNHKNAATALKYLLDFLIMNKEHGVKPPINN